MLQTVTSQEEFDNYPDKNGWFYYCGENLKNTISIQNIEMPSQSCFHLKNGVIHQENGPALYLVSRRSKKHILCFFLNGAAVSEIKVVTLAPSNNVQIKEGIIVYDTNVCCIEAYTPPLRCHASEDHGLEEPSFIVVSKAGIFSQGKYIRASNTEQIEEAFHINHVKLTQEKFLSHPEKIKFDLRKSISAQLKSLKEENQ